MLPAAALMPAAVLAAHIAIISSSSQADGQATLRYADRDAERTAEVLHELGSFDAGDVWLMPETSAPQLRAALDRAERRAAAEPGSTILLYYSGHADGEGLLLGSERFAYLELRQRLAASKAQIRVAVLDACNSGSATTPKGGKTGNGPPFAPIVDPSHVRGAAIITSSGAGELAQESGEIDGSFFTHHFLSGLRGAGDRDGDGTVTLAEAYAYVYAHTIAATVSSLWGTQHPAYDYRLAGTGDLVLTILRRERQGITFSPGADGAYTVLNRAREVVGEVQGDPRRPVRLMLPPGRYRIALRAHGRMFAADVDLPSGADTVVDRPMLREVGSELASAKGGLAPPRNALFVDYALVGRAPAGAVSSELGISYARRWARWSLGPRLSFGETSPDGDELAYRLRRLTGAVYALRRIPVGPLDVHLGAAATVAYEDQQVSSTGRDLSATVPGLVGALAVEIPLGSLFALRLAWDAGAELVPIDGSLRLRPALRGALGVGIER